MEGKSYGQYYKELKGWDKITSVKEENRGMVIALSLPDTGYKNIKEKVFSEISTDDLSKAGSFKTVTDFLDKHFKKDSLETVWEKFVDFQNCKRSDKVPVSDFIANFDSKYNLIKLEGLTLPPCILAFQLLFNANITEDDRKLVCTGINYKEQEKMYEAAKESLHKFKGEFIGGACAGSAQR